VIASALFQTHETHDTVVITATTSSAKAPTSRGVRFRSPVRREALGVPGPSDPYWPGDS
jgi:hypothetical protein